jgi:hypothetical protein
MIETFMWGYRGWGGSTRELVKAFDAAEAQRGFERPIFVDARVRREGRAVGFRGNAFGTLLGGARYRWMRGLGNQAILDGGETRLADPKAVGELLDLAAESHRLQRRVIFFCACKAPPSDGVLSCHRDLISKLVVKEARRRGVPLSVAEWPGGTPRRLVAAFPLAAARASLKGTVSSVPMPKGISPAVGVSLPWGTYSMVAGPDGDVPVVLGPAIHTQGRWSLRLWHATAGATTERLQRDILARRKDGGCEPRFSPASAKAAPRAWDDLVVRA